MDTAPNALVTIGTTVTFFHSASTAFLFPLEEIGTFPFSPVFVFYSCIFRDTDVFEFSLLCLLTERRWFRPSIFNYFITLCIKIRQNFKTYIFYHLLWGIFVPLICPLHFGLPAQLPMHMIAPHHCHVASCTHVGLTCSTHLLGDLHFLLSLCTSYI